MTPVNFTQTCDDEAPQLISHVETTHAAFPDGQALASIHEGEAARKVLPKHHLVDSGYVDSANLIQSREQHAVDLVGPTLKNHWYQAETGYDLTHFSIDSRRSGAYLSPGVQQCPLDASAQSQRHPGH